MSLGNIENSPFRNLFVIKDARTRRSSSWDQSGGNVDCVTIAAGETRTLLEVDGPGCVTHFYWTTIGHPREDLRKGVLRMYWDGEDTPSVEAPLGDFFGAGNCIIPKFTSELLTINLGFGTSFGFNCYLPMPFAHGARITLTNDGAEPFARGMYWYHIEYEQYDAPPPKDVGRFHAQWRRSCLTKSVTESDKNKPGWEGLNLTGEDNYVILDAEGQGQFVGMLLNVDNVAGQWYGEGDDMIFVDGEPFPPRYHGTGTEEIFGGGAGPNRPYFGPYTGFSTVQNEDYHRNTTMYRWYVHDPVRFSKSIRVSIEHGHANNYENDYSSVAYWYQTKPAKAFPSLPPVEKRLPLPNEDYDRLMEKIQEVAKRLGNPWAGLTEEERNRLNQEERAPEHVLVSDKARAIRAVRAAQEAAYTGMWKQAIASLDAVIPLLEDRV